MDRLGKRMKRNMITIEEIADALEISYPAAQRRLKRAGIEPDDVIGKVAFYYPKVVKKIDHDKSTGR